MNKALETERLLPELPKPAGWNYAHGADLGTPYYSETQMRSYAQAAIAKAQHALSSLDLSQAERGGEVVGWQHRIYFDDTERWSEWREGKHPGLYTNRFEERPVFAAPQSSVSIDEDMVERAAKAMWERSGNDWTWEEAIISPECAGSVEWTRDDARAALTAAFKKEA